MRNHNGIVTGNDSTHRRAAPSEPEDRNLFEAARLAYDAGQLATSLAGDPEFREWFACDELGALMAARPRVER